MRQAGVLAGRSQFRPQSRIFARVNRFLHCANYGSRLECSQNRYTTMLRIPEDWSKMHGGGIARSLLGQACGDVMRAELARLILDAAFDIADAAALARTKRLRRIKRLPNLRWQLGEGLYAFFPRPNDHALNACANRRKKPRIFTVIVPDEYQAVFGRALKSVCKGREPTLFGVEGFVSWRTGFGAMDLTANWVHVNRFLLRRYHHRATRHRSASRLQLSNLELIEDLPIAKSTAIAFANSPTSSRMTRRRN